MSKTVVAAAFALLLVALALPAQSAARWFAEGSVRLGAVTTGVLILKGALAVHALLLVLAARWAPRGLPCEPLAPRGLRPVRPGGPGVLWGIGGLCVLAVALRVQALGVGLSFDEIDTLVHYARRPLREVVSTFDSQNQHLLYSVFARLSFAAFGESAWSLRLPAALFGVLSIFAAHRLALLVADRRESIFAAALLTVSYHHLWFSQNARGYTGLLLFTLLGTHELLRMFGETNPRSLKRPLAYGTWMALAALTHATAVLIVVGHALVWAALAWRGRKRALGANLWQPVLGGVFAASFSLLGYALVLPQFFDTLLAPTLPGVQNEWKSPLWLVAEIYSGIAKGVPGGSFTLVGALVIGGLGLLSYFRQSAAVLGLFLLPAAVTLAALLATKHNLWPRMFFFGAAFYVLIAVRGIVEWARIFSFGQLPALMSKLTTAALALACLANAATLPLAWRAKQDFEGPREFLSRERRPDDAVVTVGMTTLPYAEYFIEPWTSVDIPDVARPDPQQSLAALEAIEAAHPRTWIVFTTPPQLEARQPKVWERIQSEYVAQRETFWGTLAGGEVVVVRRDRAPDGAGAR
jgi:mannosyltransferase